MNLRFVYRSIKGEVFRGQYKVQFNYHQQHPWETNDLAFICWEHSLTSWMVSWRRQERATSSTSTGNTLSYLWHISIKVLNTAQPLMTFNKEIPVQIAIFRVSCVCLFFSWAVFCGIKYYLSFNNLNNH